MSHVRLDHDLIRRLRAENKGTAEIARLTGASANSVIRIAPSDIKPGKVVPLADEDLAAIRSMLEDRAGYAEVARTFEVPARRIRKLFPGMGLTAAEGGAIGRMRAASNKVLDSMQIGGYNG